LSNEILIEVLLKVMEISEYVTMFAVEERHWWHVGMQQITKSLVAHFYPGQSDLRILDAGCGTGVTMHYLAPFGVVTGCDISPWALHFCQQRALARLGQASVVRLPFPDQQFDLVASFEVLYHRAVGDYRHALSEFSRVLQPGGHLFLRLPAYTWMQAQHDISMHTLHRFTTTELGQALAATGFEVQKLSYANSLLFPLAVGKRLLIDKIFPGNGHSDVHPNPAWQDKLFSRLLFAEAKWLKNHSLPFGLTVVAVGMKC
jgi:SAM-dependent methyltransferase